MSGLTADHFVADEIFAADIAIVFGMTAWRRPCERAVELYRGGFARKLLFTGGYNPKADAVEAETMAEYAEAWGVPSADILIEPHATYTVANVVNAYDRIEESIGIANVDAVLLVAVHFHMRRVRAIVEATFPGRIRIGCASYPSIHYTSANWQQSDRGRADVASEARKLDAFFRTSDGHAFGDESRSAKQAVACGDPIPAGSQPRSIAEGLSAGVAAFPDGKFVFIDVGGATRVVAYQEMLARARRVLRGLRLQGLQPDEPVVLRFRGAIDFVPALWASLLAGAIPLPLVHGDSNRRNATQATALAAHIAGALHNPRVIGDGDGALPVGALEADDEDNKSHIGSPDDPRILVLTSGTTTTPNLVTLSERALIGRWWPTTPDRGMNATYLSWSPFDHVMGLGLFGLNLPTKVHLAPNAFVQSPALWLDAIERYRVTHGTITNFGMDLVARAIAEGAAAGRTWDLSSVVKIGVGAEAISPDTCRRFMAALQPFGLRGDTIILGYGLSECGPVVGGNDWFDPARAERDGPFPVLDKPTRGHAVRIVDDDGRIRPEGVIGAIEVRGATMTLGYYGDDSATRALFTPDGWLRTGDLGRIADARLTVTGRTKEIIDIHAKKYACAEVEAIAASVEGIVAAFAVACRTREGARSHYALFVVPIATSEDQLGPALRRVRSRLATHFGLAPLHIVPIPADRVPRTDTGKAQRLELAAQLEAGDFDAALAAAAPVLRTPGSRSLASETERQIAAIWSDILGGEDYGSGDDFFERGGDSLSGESLLVALEKAFGRPFPTEVLREHTTIRKLAALAQGGATDGSSPPPLQAGDRAIRPRNHKRNAETLQWALRAVHTWTASLHDRLLATELLVAYGMADEADASLRAVLQMIAKSGRQPPHFLTRLVAVNACFRRGGIDREWRTLGELGRRLLSSDEESVLWKTPGSTRLLVVFCSMYGDFWVSGPVLHCLLRGMGASILYLKDPAERGFLGGLRSFGSTFAGLLEGIRESAANVGARDIRAMGFSSGSYAGLLAAAQLRASAFLGFDARSDMSPASLPPGSDRTLAEQGIPPGLLLDIVPVLRTAGFPRRGVIYYGEESEIDATHAEHLRGVPNFVIKKLARTRHNSVLPLIADGEFERVVRRFLR